MYRWTAVKVRKGSTCVGIKWNFYKKANFPNYLNRKIITTVKNLVMKRSKFLSKKFKFFFFTLLSGIPVTLKLDWQFNIIRYYICIWYGTVMKTRTDICYHNCWVGINVTHALHTTPYWNSMNKLNLIWIFSQNINHIWHSRGSFIF